MVDQVELRSRLLELAERCEAATGPDRELDKAIAMAFGWRFPRPGVKGMEVAFSCDGIARPTPRPTGSLDAAMTLVDPDVFFHLSRFSPGEGPANAHVYPNRCLGDDYEGEAATPALALCAAALKAQARTPTTPERSDG